MLSQELPLVGLNFMVCAVLGTKVPRVYFKAKAHSQLSYIQQLFNAKSVSLFMSLHY